MEEKKETRRRGSRLVLVPCPFQGHINPMLQLGTILQSKGFSITVAHSKFNSPNPLNHPNFDFLCIKDELHDYYSGDLVSLLLFVNEIGRSPLQEMLSELMAKLQKEDDEMITCVIYDEFMYFAEAVADQLRIPSMVLRTTSASSYNSRNVFSWYQAEGKIAMQGIGSQDIVPEFHPLRLKDLPFYELSSLESILRLDKNACDIKTSSAVIFNTMDILEQSSLQKIQQQQSQILTFPIGPLHKFAPNDFSGSLIKEDYDCITWLDRQTKSSVLFVSLGSLTPMTQNELVEMAWGLANSEQPFLWVIRPGSIVGSDWIESLPEGFTSCVGEKGCIVKWVPQKKVLAHDAVGGFWSHCGWNSTLESIGEGVPMICRPNIGDQKVNARYVSYVWRVGLEFENDVLERGEVERVVRRLMVEKEGMEIRQRAKDLKEKVEVSVSEGGSSRNYLNQLVQLIKSF